MTHLNEYRALRNSYGEKFVQAMVRRFNIGDGTAWREMVERAKVCPYGEIEGILLFADRLADMTDWAALTRFCWLAEKVWELESGELELVIPFVSKQHYARRKTRSAS